MKKFFMFIPLVSLINAQPNCSDVINATLYPYSVVRTHFIRDEECFSDSGSSIIKNIETNETLELDGVASGIQELNANARILLINTFDGEHYKHALNFFIIKDNGTLSPIEGGIIGSGYAMPSITIDLFNDKLIVINREYIRKNNILGIRKIKYKYMEKLKKFKKLESKEIFPSPVTKH